MSLITVVLLGGVLFFDSQNQSEAAGWAFIGALVAAAIGAYLDGKRLFGDKKS